MTGISQHLSSITQYKWTQFQIKTYRLADWITIKPNKTKELIISTFCCIQDIHLIQKIFID